LIGRNVLLVENDDGLRQAYAAHLKARALGLAGARFTTN